ncbi:5079_t:CDS:2, partial [Paraglomus occultum]
MSPTRGRTEVNGRLVHLGDVQDERLTLYTHAEEPRPDYDLARSWEKNKSDNTIDSPIIIQNATLRGTLCQKEVSNADGKEDEDDIIISEDEDDLLTQSPHNTT